MNRFMLASGAMLLFSGQTLAQSIGDGEINPLPGMSVINLYANSQISSPANNQVFSGHPEEEILVTATSNHVVRASADLTNVHNINEAGLTVQWAFVLQNNSMTVRNPANDPYCSELLALDYETGKWEKSDSLECIDAIFVDWTPKDIWCTVNSKSWIKVIGAGEKSGQDTKNYKIHKLWF